MDAKIQQLIECLRRVSERRREILALGNVAPAGAWIYTYVISKCCSSTSQVCKQLCNEFVKFIEVGIWLKWERELNACLL